MAGVAQRVAAAIRGAAKGGFEPDRIEVTPEGRIIILRGGLPPPPSGDDLDDELRAWREQNGQG